MLRLLLRWIRSIKRFRWSEIFLRPGLLVRDVSEGSNFALVGINWGFLKAVNLGKNSLLKRVARIRRANSKPNIILINIDITL